MIWIIAFLGGAILLYCLPNLPPDTSNIALFLLFAFFILNKFVKYFIVIFLGFYFAYLDASNHQLSGVTDHEKAFLKGYICSYIKESKEKLTFELCVTHLSFVDESVWKPSDIKVRVNYYKEKAFIGNNDLKSVQANIIHTLKQGPVELYGKLKPPRFSVNFGVSSIQKVFFYKNINGLFTLAKVMPSIEVCGIKCRFFQFKINFFDKLQQNISTIEFKRFIPALTLGERSAFDEEDKRVLQLTGTAHLFVVSGLHIGCLGLLVWFLINSVFKLPVILPLFSKVPYPVRISIMIYFVILSLIGLVVLSGATTSGIRAFIMFCLGVMSIYFLRIKATNIILFACLLLTLIDPKSLLMPGVWLSFAAVVVLVTRFSSRAGAYGKIQSLLIGNGVLVVLMVPAQIASGLPLSLSSFTSNLLAVPLVTFILLPLSVLLTIVSFFSQTLLAPMAYLYDFIFEVLWSYLTWNANFGLSFEPSASGYLLGILIVFMLILVLPIHFYIKTALVVVSAIILIYQEREGFDRVDVLDVGQGTSIFLHSSKRNLVYDFGPSWGETSNAGKSIVNPFLRTLGITQLDLAIVSHNDDDHRGGYLSVKQSIDIDETLAGQAPLLEHSATQCKRGELKRFSAEILWPTESLLESGEFILSNNRSCVIRFNLGGLDILMTGDIDKTVEQRLVKEFGGKLKSDILIVSHHGSNTSSSWAFIKSVAPKLAIYSAGYKSRFGHPSDEVKERFKRLGISTYNTADLGGIRVRQQFSAKLMSSNTECEENAFLSYSNECFVIEFAREHLKKIWIDSPIESIDTP